MEKVLVTGANGLLGANVVRALINNGYEVRAFVRPQSNRTGLQNIDIEFFEGELLNKDDVIKAAQGCHYIIHTAALTALSPAGFDEFFKVNVTATRFLINAAKDNNIKRFIYISTANCLTNGSLSNPGTEDSGFMPWLKKSNYAYTKYLAQQEVLREAKENNFPAIVVNPTFLIGPFDSKPSSGKLLLYANNNKILFYPPGGKSFIDAEYAAQAIVNALSLGKNGEIYLLAGENLTYKDFFRQVATVTGKRKILIPVPKPIIILAGGIMSMTGKILQTNFSFNLTNAKLLVLDNYFSADKARTELRLKPTDVKHAIIKALKWFASYQNK